MLRFVAKGYHISDEEITKILIRLNSDLEYNSNLFKDYYTQEFKKGKSRGGY